MNSHQCSLLVHTFNQYERFWDGFLSGWDLNVGFGLSALYFGTDTPEHGAHNFNDFMVLYSGQGEWSDRLIKLIDQIPTDYILYCQEDMWPCKPPPDLENLMQIMAEKDLLRLQISPVVQFYSLYGSEIPLFFHWKSKYLVSHQPSIWKKDFLLSCLEPNEDPWKNEYEGTKRLNDQSISGKIAIYPHNWFTHESVKLKN